MTSRLPGDMTTDEQLPMCTLGAIVYDANPNTWNVIGNGTGGGYPAARLQTAAGNAGGGPAWLAQSTANGTWR